MAWAFTALPAGQSCELGGPHRPAGRRHHYRELLANTATRVGTQEDWVLT